MAEERQSYDENVEQENTHHEESAESESASAFREFVHHQRIAIEELGRAVESLFPKEFREHTANAGKAFVDSFRSLVDAARDEFSKSDDADGETTDSANSAEDSSRNAATKIKVEID
jgi:hypothetical protein